jgi:hypothetical protein
VRETETDRQTVLNHFKFKQLWSVPAWNREGQNRRRSCNQSPFLFFQMIWILWDSKGGWHCFVPKQKLTISLRRKFLILIRLISELTVNWFLKP